MKVGSTVVREAAREVPVVAEFDVVVVGGGIAGVAAALAARRRGARAAVLEKEFGLGGLATLGNVIMYLPICDGRGRQVIGGISEELLKLSVADVAAKNPDMGVRPVPECWLGEGTLEQRAKDRYKAAFYPAAFQLELEELALREGVEIYYDTRFCACAAESGMLRHVIVENKTGRLAVAAKAFVDASGDADLCAAVGETTEALDNNVLCGWHYLMFNGRPKLQAFSKPYNQLGTGGAQAEGPFLAGHRGADVTAHVLETRKLIRSRLAEMRKEHPEEDIQPLCLPSIPCFRATRRLKTAFSLAQGDMHRWFDDTIGLTGDWRKPGPVYAIPLRSIQAERHRNLFAAGRCVSVETAVWDVTRAIPTCAVTGEAAGAAAALAALKHGGDAFRLPLAELRGNLLEAGVLMSPELVAAAPPLEA